MSEVQDPPTPEVVHAPGADNGDIAVVIPCHRVRDHVLRVISSIGPEVGRIYCVDDACPDGSGRIIKELANDSRVRVLYHETNQGVGGATLTGYRAAIADGATVIVKIDGDGQMDPARIRTFVEPILVRRADYTKGNRFFQIEDSARMPPVRRFGNAVLSFVSKFSGGYWHIFDPTNGYTAIHARVAAALPFDQISRRFFFESDMLFHLNMLRAVVQDVPMPAFYGDEISNLRVRRILVPFVGKHLINFWRRIGYTYFLRDFSIASVELVFGFLALAFGTIFGAFKWVESVQSGAPASAGTVMVAALPVIVGFQLLLSFLSYDIQNRPSVPVQSLLPPADAEARPRAFGSEGG